ncbi:PIG-L family deacetylase [Candidatus Woesearchaeota archaeon]|jgi:LmbE family N-acetylglucosaminyl deacetylase|nr:PIG-L family deacetylase [Candidatus Woesearchaeota archaeon]
MTKVKQKVKKKPSKSEKSKKKVVKTKLENVNISETKKEIILCFCAHNDDQVIGAGGTLAKYTAEGKEVYTYIFSYGESSHPHLHREVIVKTRVAESQAADKIISGSGIFHLGLKEGSFIKEIEERGFKERIKKIISEKKPTKIFTHSQDDPHPDHRAVNKIIREVTAQVRCKCDLFSFDIWNFWLAKGRRRPMLVVDITTTFDQKIRAIKAHKSQKMALITMIPATYARSIINGLNHHYRYAEVFYKIN